MVIFIHSYSEGINFAGGKLTLDMPIWLAGFKHVISQIICRVAVPSFFLISSILLYRKHFDYVYNIKKKMKTIVLPYFIVNSIWIVFYAVVTRIPMLNIYFSNGNMVAKWGVYEWVDAYLGLSGEPVCYPLWFLRDLFVCNVLAIIIKKVIDRFPRIIFLALMCIWIFAADSNIFCWGTQAICFFSFGYYICKYNISLSCLDKVKRIWLFLVYVVFIVLDECLFHTTLYLLYTIVHQAGIIIGIVCIFRCTTIIKNLSFESLLLRISGYSFSIYLFHELCLTILKKLCGRYLPQTEVWQLAQYIGIAVVIFFGCLIFSILLKKLLPRVYGVITGDRKV